MVAKDTDVIAKLLQRTKPDTDWGTIGEKQLWSRTVLAMRDHFRASLSGFDPVRFLETAGLEG